MTEVSLDRLKRIPLTARLSEQEILTLLPRVREKPLRKGEVLFRQGAPASDLYFVEEGSVSEVGTGPARDMPAPRHAGPVEYLGRYALVTGRPYRVTATADEDTTLLVIPLRDLQPILFAYPDWRSWFFRTEVAARLRSIPLFQGFDDWDLYVLADSVQVQEHPPASTVFEARNPADSFFVIDQGRVKETGAETRYLAAGNFFGLSSLKANQRHRATVVTQTAARLLCIPGPTIRELIKIRIGDLSEEPKRVDVERYLAGVRRFSTLEPGQRQLLAGYVSLVYNPSGAIVARQGEPATSLMILVEGEAIVRRQVGQERPRPVTYFKARQTEGKPDPGSDLIYFGDHALLAEEMRGATIEVTEPSTWIVLERSDFHQFLSDTRLSPAALQPSEELEAPSARPSPVPGEHLPLPHLVRRHWIVPVTRISPLVLLFLLAAMVLLLDVASDLSGPLRGIVLYGSLIALVLLGFWIVYRYADWWNDTYEVTNEAVIHTEKKLFLSEQRYEIPLRQIQNVNLFVSALGRILGYGDIGIDTAAAGGTIDFTKIPEPAYVQGLIQQASAQARSGQRVQVRESIREKLEDQFNPERLRPVVPGSVSISQQASPPRPTHYPRLGPLSGLFPRFEVREGDQITWRKHWLNLLYRTGLPLLASLVCAYLLFAYSLAFITDVFGLRPVELPPVPLTGYQGWILLLILLLSSLAFLWVVYKYVDWLNDVYILTSNEVIDVERELAIFPFWFLYEENRRQASLANVQFVDFRIPSPVAIIFNYGDVIVQTAGAEGVLTFLMVSKPKHVHTEILRRLAEYQERQREREFEDRWKDMAEWFEAYQSFVEQGRSDRT